MIEEFIRRQIEDEFEEKEQKEKESKPIKEWEGIKKESKKTFFEGVATAYQNLMLDGTDYLMEFEKRIDDDAMLNSFEKVAMKLLKKDEVPEHLLIMASLIGQMLSRGSVSNEDIASSYADIISEILKPRVKEIAKGFKKKQRPDDTYLLNVASLLPTPALLSENNLHSYVNKLNEITYNYISDVDTDFSLSKEAIVSLYETLFGEESIAECIIATLLENPKFLDDATEGVMKHWNKVTDVCLGILDSLD